MDLEQILDEIKKLDYKKIAIQVPDGLKKSAIDIAGKIKELGKKPFIISSSCFGACDLPYNQIIDFNCDCLIHIGHSKFYGNFEEKIPTFYCEVKFKGDSLGLLKKNYEKIKETKIGLVSTIQHLHELKKIKEFLESKGKIVIIGKRGLRTRQEGQILGCDITSAEKIHQAVDCFLFLGSGDFHVSKLLELRKKIYQLNPYQQIFSEPVLDIEKEKRREILKVLKYQNEKKWGIILSSKPGQSFPELADQIKKVLQRKNKEVFMFIADKIVESDYMGFGIKIFVNTACPRITADFTEFALVNPWTLEYLE